MKKVTKIFLMIVLTTAVFVCGHELFKIASRYADEARIKKEMSRYFPEPAVTQNDDESDDDIVEMPVPLSIQNVDATDEVTEEETEPPEETAPEVNEFIVEMQNEVNGDIVGWLTVPGTHIDYPLVISDDNDFYLLRNINKEPAKAGSLFLDFRCGGGFTGFNTVIYGHNMKNRSMFGDLRMFAETDFFNTNSSGTLIAADRSYTLEIFAYMVVREDDTIIYDPYANREEFFEYIKQNARQHREPSSTENIATLSTCAYEFDGARIVVLAAMLPS